MTDLSDEYGLDPEEMHWIYSEHCASRNAWLLTWIDQFLQIQGSLTREQFQKMVDGVNHKFKHMLLKDGIIFTGNTEDIKDE